MRSQYELSHEDDAGRAFGWELIWLWAIAALVDLVLVAALLGAGWVLWHVGLIKAVAAVLLLGGSVLIGLALAEMERRS